jgi:hypothetical protein
VSPILVDGRRGSRDGRRISRVATYNRVPESRACYGESCASLPAFRLRQICERTFGNLQRLELPHQLPRGASALKPLRVRDGTTNPVVTSGKSFPPGLPPSIIVTIGEPATSTRGEISAHDRCDGNERRSLMRSSITPLTLNGISRYASDFQSILNRAVQFARLPVQRSQIEHSKIQQESQAASSLSSSVAGVANALTALGKLG